MLSLGLGLALGRGRGGGSNTPLLARFDSSLLSFDSSSRTMDEEADTVPDAFSFSAVTDATPSTDYDSNTVVLAGLNTTSPLTVTGGTVSINSGAQVSSGTVSNGDRVKARLTSSASYATLASCTVDIGGVTADFEVTTEAAPVTVPTLVPSADWNGTTSWVGRSVPTDDTTVYGSGFAEQVVAVFDEPDGMWVETTDYAITVGAGLGDRSMIDSVTFWLEGNTEVVSDMTVNERTGSIGFCVNVASRSGQNGDAQLYAQVKPVNGVSRLIGPLNLTLNTDAGTLITRPEFYVDLDAAVNGTGSVGSPWNNFTTPLNSTLVNGSNGGIVHVSGTTEGNVPNAGIANTRMIEFRGAAANRGTTLRPSSTFRWTNTRVMWTNFTIKTDDLNTMYGCSTTSGRMVLNDCWVGHSESASGALDKGYPVGIFNNSKINLFYRTVEGQKWYLLDCDVQEVHAAGIWLWRNCNASVGGDLIQIGSSPLSYGEGVAVFGLNAKEHGNAETRSHSSTDITVASVAVGTGTQKVITFSGTPGILTANNAPQYLRILQNSSGVPIGDVQFRQHEDGNRDYEWLGYTCVSASTTSTTITVNDLNNVIPTGVTLAGALCRAYFIAHGDIFQTVRQADNAPTVRNIYIQGLKARGHSWQPILMQSTYQTDTSLSSASGNGTPIAISSVKFTSSGTTATFSGPHGIQQWGWLKIMEGAQTGEYRLIVDVPSTTTVTLASAFSVDQASPVSWGVRRGIKDVFICNSVLYLTASTNDLGHIEPGVIHHVWVNVTVPGVAPNGNCVSFTQQSLNGVTAYRTVRFFDCLLRNLAVDVSLPAEFAGDNNWYGTGTNRDTGGAADGDFWTTLGDAYADGYLAPASVTRTHAGKTVMVPYDLNKVPRTSSSPVGALAA